MTTLRDKLRSRMLESVSQRQGKLSTIVSVLIKKYGLSYIVLNSAIKPGEQQGQRVVVAMYCDDWHLNMLKPKKPTYTFKVLNIKGVIDELGDTLQCRHVVNLMRQYDPKRDLLLLAVDTHASPRDYCFQRLYITTQ